MIKKNIALSLLLFSLSIPALKGAQAAEADDTCIEGNLFIIPNPINSAQYYDVGPFVRNLEKFLGKKIEPTEKLVEVWASDDTIENWGRHGHPLLKNRFPDYLPLPFLESLQEKSILHLVTEKQQVRLRCNQLQYRYQNYGLDFPEMITWLLLDRPGEPNIFPEDRILIKQKTIERLAKHHLAEHAQNKQSGNDEV